MVEHFVTTGIHKDTEKLGSISNYINKLCVGREKAHHIWTEETPPEIHKQIEEVRTSHDVLDVIRKAFPNSRISNVREADEIYWAVSPKHAKGSDRSLVDCHYDAPFAILPTNSTYYRIIIACNENKDVITQFPSEKVEVKMNTGDFHGLDYNTDYHCVEGSIPAGKYRVLLKLHYMIVPNNLSNTDMMVNLNYFLNITWTKLSRWFMRASAEPQNPIEYGMGGIVNVSRFVFNGISVTQFFVGGGILLSLFFFRKQILKFGSKLLR
jgi:hypothetical protein